MKVEWSNPIHFGGLGGYKWPNYEGVYVIAEKINGKLIAKYVGQGVIKDNMDKHKDWKNEQNDCLAKVMKNRDEDTKVFHAEVKDDQDRNNAELTIYTYYGGKDLLCNENDPPLGKYDYTINFPFSKIDPNY